MSKPIPTRFVELNAHLDRAIEFADQKEKRAQEKGQNKKDNMDRGGIVSGFLTGPASAPAAIHNGASYEAAGKVYRKRDAFRDGAAGLGGGIAGAIAGGMIGSRIGKKSSIAGPLVGGLGGAYAVGRLTGTAALKRRQNADKDSKNFMSKSITARLVELNAHLDDAVEFAQNPRQQEEKPSMLKRAAGVAGVGALAVGGLYARGRLARNGGKWGKTGVAGVLDADGKMGGLKGAATSVMSDIKRGAGKTVDDLKGVPGNIRDKFQKPDLSQQLRLR